MTMSEELKLLKLLMLTKKKHNNCFLIHLNGSFIKIKFDILLNLKNNL